MLATDIKPMTFLFADDGVIPNNPSLPLLIYPKAFDLAGADDSAAVIEQTFEKNGWGDCWRNGVYPYAHYHSRIHEALAVARGRARVRFGGNEGEEIDIEASVPIPKFVSFRGGLLYELRNRRTLATH